MIEHFGSWRSPIVSDLIVAGSVGLDQPRLDGADTYWAEGRPTEAGRVVIVRRTADGQTSDVTPAPFNVRTRAHEYGGGAYAVADGVVYFANFADQRIYRQVPGQQPTPVTTAGAARFADMLLDRARNRLIAVCEDHAATDHEAVNTLVAIPLNRPAGEAEPVILAEGYDFYSTPRLSPTGDRLAWLCWRHPNMPWDGCELWNARVHADGRLVDPVLVAGGLRESIFEPEWSPTGVLHFVSDRSGWWNLYRAEPTEGSARFEVIAIAPRLAEFGVPQWVFGITLYDFTANGDIVCGYFEGGIWRLGRIAAAGQPGAAGSSVAVCAIQPIETGQTEVRAVRVAGERAVILAGSPTESFALWQLDLGGGTDAARQLVALRRSGSVTVDPGYLSVSCEIEFPTEGGLTARGYYYPARNRDYSGPADERPPLLVKSHGGPTGATSTTLQLSIQYWTSRGIAVLDVNYGGSTGYGRAYRERLNGNWGIVDVNDCANGALYLARLGEVDGERLMIEGGSAGGYTTLAALTFRRVFKAGASRYGVSDLAALATDTHKFESRYLDGVVGPYPEQREVYEARSPIHHVDQLACPVIFFQGLDDKVVLPDQAERMVAALRSRGIPVAYVQFEGEGHGFRRAENIKRSLDAELYFYSRIFGFDLADPVEPVEIDNLGSS